MNDAYDITRLSSLLLSVRKLASYLNEPFNADAFSLRFAYVRALAEQFAIHKNCPFYSEYDSLFADLSNIYLRLRNIALDNFKSDSILLPSSISLDKSVSRVSDFPLLNSSFSQRDFTVASINAVNDIANLLRSNDYHISPGLHKLFNFAPKKLSSLSNNLSDYVDVNVIKSENFLDTLSNYNFRAKYFDILHAKNGKILEKELENAQESLISEIENLYIYALKKRVDAIDFQASALNSDFSLEKKYKLNDF